MLKYAKPLKISFCTTCMNRTEYLKQTLPKNIEDNNSPFVEFVVLNYSSKDDLDNWIKTTGFVASGKVKYYKLDGKDHFHMSHAKNVAGKLGSGDIIMNLDADMYAGKDLYKQLLSVFKHENTTFACAIDYVNGKMATTKQCFLDITGYDEKMMGWGVEDFDMMQRSRFYGNRFAYNKNREFSVSIPHDNETRVKNFNPKFKNMDTTQQANAYIHKYNMVNKIIAANRGQWGKAKITKNFSQQIEI